MGFGDLKNDSGLTVLDNFLADISYISGYQPSAADSVVFSALPGAPNGKFVHALRWYNHIKSHNHQSFPGSKKSVNDYGPAVSGGAGAADEDDFDLFGSDDEEESAAAEKLKEERIAAYQAKKTKKPALIAKSNIILDVKPWSDETDMKKIEELVRTIKCDGLLWGASKFVPLAYGIKKLQICCVVEDDKVGTDFLEESITEFEDYVQSVDIAAFNKI
jgi:elongation factor 1-beta